MSIVHALALSLGLVIVEQNFGDGECSSAADCADKNLTFPVCVNQTGGFYSQCVDCEAVAFESACIYWTNALKKPAEVACDLKCTGVPPGNLTCTTDDDCAAPTSSCVIQDDGQYSQCISCDEFTFQQDCPSWSNTFLPKAEAKCGLKCTGAGGLKCHTDADCDPAHPVCIVQADGFYAQCITCDPAQFALDCNSWDPQQFLPVAENKCKLSCTPP